MDDTIALDIKLALLGRELKEDYLNFLWSDFRRSNAHHMTPIEKLLFFALLHVVRIQRNFKFKIEPQKIIHEYRVDFLITEENCEKKIVVECDGHDFHERTKEQASKDKKRDRDLTSAGFTVVRFSGSEIWKDALKCAEDIFYMLANFKFEEHKADNNRELMEAS